jgi:hypothetical protein
MQDMSPTKKVAKRPTTQTELFDFIAGIIGNPDYLGLKSQVFSKVFTRRNRARAWWDKLDTNRPATAPNLGELLYYLRLRVHRDRAALFPKDKNETAKHLKIYEDLIKHLTLTHTALGHLDSPEQIAKQAKVILEFQQHFVDIDEQDLPIWRKQLRLDGKQFDEQWYQFAYTWCYLNLSLSSSFGKLATPNADPLLQTARCAAQADLQTNGINNYTASKACIFKSYYLSPHHSAAIRKKNLREFIALMDQDARYEDILACKTPEEYIELLNIAAYKGEEDDYYDVACVMVAQGEFMTRPNKVSVGNTEQHEQQPVPSPTPTHHAKQGAFDAIIEAINRQKGLQQRILANECYSPQQLASLATIDRSGTLAKQLVSTNFVNRFLGWLGVHVPSNLMAKADAKDLVKVVKAAIDTGDPAVAKYVIKAVLTPGGRWGGHDYYAIVDKDDQVKKDLAQKLAQLSDPLIKKLIEKLPVFVTLPQVNSEATEVPAEPLQQNTSEKEQVEEKIVDYNEDKIATKPTDTNLSSLPNSAVNDEPSGEQQGESQNSSPVSRESQTTDRSDLPDSLSMITNNSEQPPVPQIASEITVVPTESAVEKPMDTVDKNTVISGEAVAEETVTIATTTVRNSPKKLVSTIGFNGSRKRSVSDLQQLSEKKRVDDDIIGKRSGSQPELNKGESISRLSGEGSRQSLEDKRTDDSSDSSVSSISNN